MVRSDLVQRLLEDNPDFTPRDAEAIVAIFFNMIVQQLATGGRVELRGFGAFAARRRRARVGRNPRTGDQVQVDTKRLPRFKPGKGISELLNQ